jgi:hypothetical protein
MKSLKGINFMDAYECHARLMDEGYLEIPLAIRKKLKKDALIKLVILVDEEKPQKKQLHALKELNGLLADLNEENMGNFDETLKERVNFKREFLNL